MTRKFSYYIGSTRGGSHANRSIKYPPLTLPHEKPSHTTILLQIISSTLGSAGGVCEFSSRMATPSATPYSSREKFTRPTVNGGSHD